jgi:EpsI family protein
VPAFIAGNLIHLPSGTFEVAGGCAGLRYAIVAGTLGAFLGLRHYRHWQPTLLLTICALGLALVGNWVRVLILVLVGHYSQMQNYLIVEDHSLFGWVVFVVFMAPLFYAHRVLSSRSTDSASLQTARAEPDPSGPAGSRWAAVYFACVALAFGVVLNYRIADGGQVSNVVLAAPEIQGWSATADWADARRPEFVGATAQLASWYEDGTERVGAYIAHYTRQAQGREIVFSQHRPQGQGAVVGRQRITIQAASGSQLAFEQLEVADFGAKRRLVWVGLRVAGRVAGGETAAKFLQIAGAVRGRRDAQALVLTAECSEDCSHAEATLSRFAGIAAERLYAETERSASRVLEDPAL